MCQQCNDLYQKFLSAQAEHDEKKARVMYVLWQGCKSSLHPPERNVVAVAADEITWPNGKKWKVG